MLGKNFLLPGGEGGRRRERGGDSDYNPAVHEGATRTFLVK